MFVSKFHLLSLSLATLCIVFTTRADGQNNTQRGATLGGLAGAVAGGLIGDHNDEAGAGAGIGAVVGAVAGGLLGNAADKDAAYARQQHYYRQQQQQAYYQQQRVAQVQSAVTINDVVSMTRSGLSDQVINNQIRQRGYVGTIAVSDIIALHQQGVRESVITTIQMVASQPRTVGPTVPAQPQVLAQPQVIERHYVRPAPVVIEEHVLPAYPMPRYRHSRVHIHHRF